MNRRFAQIIADSTDPKSGQIDRARLFAALETDQRDPIAPIFDAAAFTFDMVKDLRGTLPEELANRFRDLLSEFESLQRANAERAKSASVFAQEACDRLERWAHEFAVANRAASQREIALIREASVAALTESGKVAKSAQLAILRSVEEMKFGQDQLIGKWEQVRFKAEDAAAALSGISFFIWFALLAVAFGVGLFVGRMR